MPWVKMSIGAERDTTDWSSRPVESLDKGIVAEFDSCVPLGADFIKKSQAFGWLKQQALLRERKLNPKGTPVKQRLFRSGNSTRN